MLLQESALQTFQQSRRSVLELLAGHQVRGQGVRELVPNELSAVASHYACSCVHVLMWSCVKCLGLHPDLLRPGSAVAKAFGFNISLKLDAGWLKNSDLTTVKKASVCFDEHLSSTLRRFGLIQSGIRR